MILALIVLAVVFVLMIKGLSDPFIALLAFVTVYEIQPGELYPALAFMHLERILLVFILVLAFVNHIHLRFPAITKRFLAFYGAILLATPFAFWVSNSIQFDISFFEIVVYHMLLVSMLNTEERIRKYIMLYAGLIAWIGATALYDYQNGVRQFTMGIDRAVGLTSSGGDPNSLASTMVISMPFALLLMGKGNSKKVKLYGIAVFAVYLITIIDTGSRTAFLAFIIFLLISVFQKKKNWKILPLILILLPLLWMVIPEQYKARYESIETRDQDESYTNRLLSWQGGVQMFLHNPVTGIGPDDYTTANGTKYWPGYPRHWLNAHSLYFKLLGELGLVGVITFAMYLFSVFRLNFSLIGRFRRENANPFIANLPYACNISFILLLFSGYAAHNTYRSTWYTLGAVTAAAGLLRASNQASDQEQKKLTVSKKKQLPAWAPAAKTIDAESVGV